MLTRINRMTVMRLLIALIYSTQSMAHAAPQSRPLVASGEIGQLEIEAFSEAMGRRTLAEYLDAERPGLASETRLRKRLERAQAAWLSGSPEDARRAFEELADLALEADWRGTQREALHYAHLRIAQTSTDEAARDAILERAGSLFPDVVPDASLFPPPLLVSYAAALARVRESSLEVPLGAFFPDDRFVLVNGRRFAITPTLKVKLSAARHRITLLSDSRPPVTLKGAPGAIRPTDGRKPLATGSCQEPELIKFGLPSGLEIDALYANECLRSTALEGSAGEAHKLSGLAPSIGERAQPSSDMVRLVQSDPLSSAPPAFAQRAASSQKGMSRTHWIWIGLGALATGVTVTLLRESQRSRPEEASPQVQTRPVTVEGFGN